MNYDSIESIVKDLEDNPVESNGNTYHRIPFPEFDHLKTSSNAKAVDNKCRIIQQTITSIFGTDLSGKRILDVGANGGLYTFSLAQMGAEVVSFEPHPRYAPIGQFLARNKPYSVEWHATAFDPKLVDGRNFDVALMLSVYQWMCGGDSTDRKSLRELRFVSEKCRYLFFELGFNHGKSCIVTKKRNHYGYLIQYIKDNTDYEYFRLLSRTRLWRGDNRFLVLCSNEPSCDDKGIRKILRQVSI